MAVRAHSQVSGASVFSIKLQLTEKAIFVMLSFIAGADN